MDKAFTQQWLLPRKPTRDLAYDSSKLSQFLGTPTKKDRKMSVRERPHDALIRYLYVDKRKSIEEVHYIVNREFGLTKKKRYYKNCIKRLKIERNVNLEDKQKIIRVIKILQCTTENLESRLQVWVRGHNVDMPRWSRWLKDDRLIPQPIPLGPPSPLPSYISISLRQSPGPASPVLSDHICECESVTKAEWERGVIQRLNKYAGYEDPKLDPQESKAVLEDLQIILGYDDAPAVESSPFYKWDTIVDEYTIKVNEIIAGSIINEELSAAIIDQHPLKTKGQLQIGRRVSAAQRTRHGFVEFTYWIDPKSSHFDFANQCTNTSRLNLARLSIVPRETAPFRIVIDVTPWLNLPARIAYQPMIPSDSEVFDIAKSGQVEALQRAIGKGTASLLDRDKQGRPLLYYAALNSHVELSRYLIKHGADVNELVEVEKFIRPIYSLTLPLFISRTNDEHYQMCHCFKIMMEGGADLSLKASAYYSRHTIFYLGTLCAPFESFKHMIYLGQQFICPKEFFEVFNGKKRYPLHFLAEQCGYGLIFESVDITEKAILLLESGANISYSDCDGCTVLHIILAGVRYHQYWSKERARCLGRVRQWTRSFYEPKEFLMAFIAAGGDVYAINDKGSTPSMYARWHCREKEWLEVLESAGYDPEEVVAHSDPKFHDCSRERQASRLSLKEYCLRRKEEPIVRSSDIIDEDKDVNDDIERSNDGSYSSDIDTGEDEEIDEDEPAERCQRCSMRLDDDEISDHYRRLLVESGQ